MWILLVNIMPLIGVRYFGWSVPEIVTIYYVESCVVGLLFILRIIDQRERYVSVDFAVLGFLLKYGFLMTVLGFVLQSAFDVSSLLAQGLSFGPLFWVGLSLVLSHVITLWREYHADTISVDIRDSLHPFHRLTVLFIAIFLGGAFFGLGQPVMAMVFIVTTKLVFELGRFIRDCLGIFHWPEFLNNYLDNQIYKKLP